MSHLFTVYDAKFIPRIGETIIGDKCPGGRTVRAVQYNYGIGRVFVYVTTTEIY
ncbi:hypothetical protein [Ralstonia phage RSP15]|uniref:hypothetical protein n=1 Tax=Ralstonia phage RSP15 TaxID=1785960 RepID=UPI00074D34E3|nr:hypothetical protein BH754_gp126 [Ralstonia phage RSP15]BAU40180.1 hypothetical protein [Ralstonia phage RSP15]